MSAHLNKDVSRAQFCLKNGADRLAPWFDQLALRRYDDALKVTEVEPLVAYVQSSATSEDMVLSGEGLEQFRACIAAHIATHGHFYITKDSGTFIARQTIASKG